MEKRLILDAAQFSLTLDRLTHQLIENHQHFEETVILGLQPRGKYLAERIAALLEKQINQPVRLGYLDVTFHRDDFRKRNTPLIPSEMDVPFNIEDTHVVLIDDVLYTGRTARSAMDAMLDFGRPESVELLVLIDRKYQRDLPIQPDYVGKEVNTLKSQRVSVNWSELGQEDQVWLENKPESNE